MQQSSFLQWVLLLSIFVGWNIASAQCAIDSSTQRSISGIYPNPLPTMEANVTNSVDITFVFPRDTLVGGLRVPFNEFTITGIAGLPAGVSWVCNMAPNCVYDLRSSNPTPDSVGCVNLSGTPTLPGTYPLQVQLNVLVPLGGTQQAAYDATLIVTPQKRNTPCFTTNLSTVCAPATLSLTNDIPSNGQAGFTYDWNISGPNGFQFQTNLESPAPQVLADSGTYVIDYTATIDTIGFVLDSIVITGVDCDDDFGLGAPDLYWILTDPNGTALINTSGSPLTNATIPQRLSGLNLLLAPGLYEFEVWDEDGGLGGTDDGCADGNNNGQASVFLDLATAQVGVNAITNLGLSVNFYLSKSLSIEMCSDTIYINPTPDAPEIMALTDTIICVGDSATLMISSTDSIQWYQDGVAIPGANDERLFIKEAGIYTVEVINLDSRCSNVSTASIEITVIDIPIPTVVQTANGFAITNVQPGITYNWALNGQFVGSGNTLPFGRSGLYRAVGIDPNTGCMSDSSETISYIATGIDARSNLAAGLQVIPNPSQGAHAAVRFALAQGVDVTLQVQDLQGKQLWTRTTQATTGDNELSVDAVLPAGMYIVTVTAGESRGSVKWVIR